MSVHLFFSPDEPHGVTPAELSKIEGNRASIVTPNGSAHIPTSLVDTHPGLLVAMVNAARKEHGA